MKTEIIAIGDEILLGQTIDTNSAWLGEELNKIGMPVDRVVTIHDTREEIIKALDDAFTRAELVICTGGLGPTQDDLTKYTLAEYFGTELERNEEVLNMIREYFRSKNLPILDSNERQADLPKGIDLLPNIRGTAQGMWFEKEGKVVLSMPGVPYEMKGMMREHGFEKIKKHFQMTPVVNRTVLTQGIGESFLAHKISDWETRLRQDNLALAYLPSPGIVRLRISGKGEDTDAVYQKIGRYIDELYEIVPEYIYGQDRDTLEGLVGKLLRERGLTAGTAESCTGGYIAHLITSIAGSSEYFLGGIVSYHNNVKQNVLGVSAEDLKNHGAVSEQVACQMAEGARKALGTDFAVSTTGVAGPEGGSEEKPVGTVWIGISGPQGTTAKKYTFGRSRSRNIRQSALQALSLLRKQILQEELV